MFRITVVACGLVALCSTPLRAETEIELQLIADGDSRWFELFSASFLQITPPAHAEWEDGFFAVQGEATAPDPFDVLTFDADTFVPTIFKVIGGGVDAFPNETIFHAGYTVAYDESGLDGVGLESAPLVSASLDFQPDFAATDIIGQFDNYSTEVLSTSGHVQFLDGEVAGLNGEVELTFTYPQFGGAYSVPGTLKFCGGSWELDADGVLETSSLVLRSVWDGHGYLEGLAETGLGADFNNTGAVDGADFLQWQRKQGARHHSLPNDVDGGAISLAQLTSWQTQYGQAISLSEVSHVVSDVVQVPEPSTAALVFIVSSIASLYRTRRIEP